MDTFFGFPLKVATEEYMALARSQGRLLVSSDAHAADASVYVRIYQMPGNVLVIDDIQVATNDNPERG